MCYTEDNFKEQPFLDVVKSVQELVKEAEKFGVIVGIEGGINHPVYSPKLMKRLLDSVNSNNLQVIFDHVNYITIENYDNQEAVFKEAMDLFGERIIILHAKDFIIENNWIKTAPIGKGFGGITTLEDKSLGCTQKAGTSTVIDVLKYGEI